MSEQKIFDELLEASKETMGLWSKHGLGDDEAESFPVYRRLNFAILNAELVQEQEHRKAATQAKPYALDVFVEYVTAARSECERIKSALDEHFGTGPDAVNWSHVAEAQRVLSDLGDITAYLYDEEWQED